MISLPKSAHVHDELGAVCGGIRNVSEAMSFQVGTKLEVGARSNSKPDYERILYVRMGLRPTHGCSDRTRNAAQDPFGQGFTSSPGPVVRSLEPVSTTFPSFPSLSLHPRAYSQTYETIVFLTSAALQPCRTALLTSENTSPDSGSLLSDEPTPAKPHSSRDSARRLNPRSFVIGRVTRSDLSLTYFHWLTDPSRSTLR